MRELLEIATDKGVRRFVMRTREAGLSLAHATHTDPVALYKAERGIL